MWFKNAIFYRFDKAKELDFEQLEKALQEYQFKEAGSQQVSSFGWTKVLGESAELFSHVANGCVMICAQRQEKILPADVIRRAHKARIDEVISREARKVGKKEREHLKDQVIQELLPKAFSRYSKSFAYIDTKRGLFVVDASAFKKAEDLGALLRKSLGSLPIVPTHTKNMPTDVMTNWLRSLDKLPAGIVLGDAVELRDPVYDGGIVRLTRQEITEDEVTTHLNVGKVATRIAINWEDQVSMVLHEDVRLTGIKFDDRLVERAMDQGDGESAAAQFDADFVIMAETMAQLYVRITGLFGGIETGEDEGK